MKGKQDHATRTLAWVLAASGVMVLSFDELLVRLANTAGMNIVVFCRRPTDGPGTGADCVSTRLLPTGEVAVSFVL